MSRELREKHDKPFIRIVSARIEFRSRIICIYLRTLYSPTWRLSCPLKESKLLDILNLSVSQFMTAWPETVTL